MANFEQLSKYVGEFDEAVNEWIKTLGLSYTHFSVLMSLAEMPDGCTQKQIGEDWFLPKQTVFNICKEYREKGWIYLEESPNDKREKILRLTESGKAVAVPIKHATDELFTKAFARFGKKKTQQLFLLISEFSQICHQEIALHQEHTKG